MGGDFTRKNYLLSHLDQALHEGWITIYYQPIFHSLSHKLSMAEALSRWIDPQYGFLNPIDFIPVLEEARLLYKLDLYVLELACQDIERARTAGREMCPVSINLSRHDLELPEIHKRINEVLSAHQIPHDMIRIEITESALADSEELAKHRIEDFRSDGYSVWLDDFGCGYSSFNTLQNFNFDGVKLDMDFLRKGNERTPVILKSIIAMMKKLGVLTLCEGVETEEQRAFLCEIGCSYLQGYYFSKPLPILDMIHEMSVRGVELETPADRIFYREVGRVNVMDVENPIRGSEHHEDIPLAIIGIDGKEILPIYANQKCRNYTGFLPYKSFGQSTPEEELSDYQRSFLQLAATSEKTGQPTISNFVSEEYVGSISVQYITAYRDRSAFLLRGLNIVPFKDSMASRIHFLQDLYSLFDSVEEIIPGKNIITHLYGTYAPLSSMATMRLRQGFRFSATQLVHPAEQKRFLEFLNPDTMQARIADTPNHILNGFFHLKSDNGYYVWKRVALAEVPDQNNFKRFLLCICRNLVGWEEELLDYANRNDRVAEDISDGTENTDILKTASLWRALVNQKGLGMFWKDKERRFVGVNAAFLRYYNLKISDLLGKNDEDMGWHPDPEPFKRDEERVLQDGAVITGAMGECLVNGKIRKIMASKAPIYEKNKIVGLIGFFMDVTDAANQSEIYRNSLYLDMMTGLLNQRGLEEESKLFETRLSGRDMTFGVIAVQIKNLKSFTDSYGAKAFSDYLKKVGDVISEVVKPDGIVGHVSLGRFGIIVPVSDEKVLRKIVTKLKEELRSLQSLDDGTPCTVYAMVGSALHRADRLLEETIAEADSRLRDVE